MVEEKKKKQTNRKEKKKTRQADSYTAEAFKKFPLGFTPEGPQGVEELCAKMSGTKEENKQLSPNELLTSGLFI